jgi:hypothetical protein
MMDLPQPFLLWNEKEREEMAIKAAKEDGTYELVNSDRWENGEIAHKRIFDKLINNSVDFERNLFIQEVNSKGWKVEKGDDGSVKITVIKPSYLDIQDILYYLAIYMEEDVCKHMETYIEKQLKKGISNVQFVIYFQ